MSRSALLLRLSMIGLVGYWSFERLDAEGRVPDLAGNGNAGTLMFDAHLVASEDAPVR